MRLRSGLSLPPTAGPPTNKHEVARAKRVCVPVGLHFWRPASPVARWDVMRKPGVISPAILQAPVSGTNHVDVIRVLASEQAMSRLSESLYSKFSQNRELTGKYRQEPPSEAIGAIDRSRAQFNEAYLEDLVSWSGRRWGVRRWR